MRRVQFSQWGLGLLLLFAGAMGGCKRSSAAQPPYKPPGTGPETVPTEPCLTPEEARTRKDMFNMFKDPDPLLEPDKAESNRHDAIRRLSETFERLPEALRKRIDVSQPICLPSKIACYVDVAYPDWKTFAEVNRAVIDANPPSPFMSFPGAHYRTGRVHIERKDKKYLASWFLALQLRPPSNTEICKREEHY